MKHYVNLSLLFAFSILTVSAVLRFFQPFEIATTRIHIVFGTLILVLVALHLAAKPKYFLRFFKRKDAKKSTQTSSASTLLLPLFTSAYLLVACLQNWTPVPQLIALGYEAKNRASIFRPEQGSVSRPIQNGLEIKRQSKSASNILIDVEWTKKHLEELKNIQAGDRPQIAIWAESSSGALIETFFVSEQSAYSEKIDWAGQILRRVEVLPVWRNRFTLATGVEPNGEIDSYSGATLEHSFSVEKYLEEDASGFYICVEINAAKDENETYNSAWDESAANYTRPGLGQPSVYYSVYLDPSEKRKYSLVEYVGHGGASNEQDGHVKYDSSGITSARDLVEKILVRVIRP